MKKPEYEAPEFAFQELQLVERVADKCWGAKLVWYDENKNGVYDPNTEPFFEGSCKGIDDKIKDMFPEYYTGENDVRTNSKLENISKIFS